MKKYVILMIILAFTLPQKANADWASVLGKTQRKNPLKYDRHYYEHPLDVHMHQYDQGPEMPKKYENERNYFAQWVQIGIIQGRGMDRQEVPYLSVGPNFYHLSGWEKRDVAKVMDYSLRLTSNPSKMYRLRDWQTGYIVGTYGEGGLILQ